MTAKSFEALDQPQRRDERRGSEPSVFSALIASLRLIVLGYAVALGAVGSTAYGRINVTTLPGRDTVQLTVYNSADLTMVKETRTLVFRKGLNHLEFSWANTLIDPTSVEFRALSHADEVDVLDVSFPPRVTDTLEWRINSEYAGEVKVEIRYFTSGISWAADYVAEASKDEKAMSLAGSVRVNNNSGEDYENAQVRLVVGVVRLVEEIRQLAQAQQMRLSGNVSKSGSGALYLDGGNTFMRLGDVMEDSLAKTANKPREIVKEEMSEYFLYTVEGHDTIRNGWSKRLPSFKTPNVPVTSYYKFEKEHWGDSVMRYYRFTNSVPSKLGSEPLPDGTVKAFRVVNDDQLYQYVGATQVKYIPVNETVELELGNDPEVLIKPTLMDWQKTDVKFDQNDNISGWTIKQTWRFEVQNSKEIDVVLDIRRNFNGDWDLETQAEREKVDANQVKFVVPLKPHEKRTFTYDLTTRFGVNGTRSLTRTPSESAAGETYTVKSGDTLTAIAMAHGTTVNELRSANNLGSDRIVVGQKLKIPAKAVPADSGAGQ